MDSIKCTSCPYKYHCLCVGLKATSTKTSWICPNCMNKRPKVDNTNTPLKEPVDGLSFITLRKTRPPRNLEDVPSPCDDLRSVIESGNQSLKMDIQSIRAEITASSETLRADMETRLTRIEAGVARMSEIESELLEAKKRIAVLESLHNNQLKATIQQLETSANFQQQYNLRNELEIAGVPETENENLQHIVTLISKKVGIDLSVGDVDEVTRAGPKRALPAKAPYDGLPRLIVIKLVRRIKRNELFQAAKARRNLTSENIVDSPPKQLYINERLSKANRLLFRDARLCARHHGFRYCWVRDGAIYARRADKQPAIHIKTSEDLATQIGPLPALASSQPRAPPST